MEITQDVVNEFAAKCGYKKVATIMALAKHESCSHSVAEIKEKFVKMWHWEVIIIRPSTTPLIEYREDGSLRIVKRI